MRKTIYMTFLLTPALVFPAISSEPKLAIPRTTQSPVPSYCLHDDSLLSCDCDDDELLIDLEQNENSFVGSYSDYQDQQRTRSSNAIRNSTPIKKSGKSWKEKFIAYDVFTHPRKNKANREQIQPISPDIYKLNPLQELQVELQKAFLSGKTINTDYYIRLFKLNTGSYPGNIPGQHLPEKIRSMDLPELINAIHKQYTDSQDNPEIDNSPLTQAILAAKKYLIIKK